MLVAFSTSGNGSDALVEQRFGRCKNFVIIDSETGTEQLLPNPAAMAAGGAGIKAAESLVKAGVQAVATGTVGPNAYQVLSSAGITVYHNVSGNISSAMESIKGGEGLKASGPTVDSHHGLSK